MDSTKGTDTPPLKDETKDTKVRSLKSAIDAVRNRQADQRDVVVDLGEAEKARLDLLAAELLPIFEELDEADDRFDLVVSRGDRPRMWIDMTTFVTMGHDKLSYRLLKDTRMGRILLAETDNMDKMADFVSDYVAEKVLEREKMIEGEWRSMMSVRNAAVELSSDAAAVGVKKDETRPKKRSGFMIFLLMLLCAMAVAVALGFFMVPPAN